MNVEHDARFGRRREPDDSAERVFPRVPNPELFIAFVKAVGTNLAPVIHEVQSALSDVSYQSHLIKIIDRLPAINSAWTSPGTVSEGERARKMTIGNEFRRKIKDNAAMAMEAVRAIQAFRKETNARGSSRDNAELQAPLSRYGFLIDSLKTPEEIDLLRSIYGTNLFVISVYEAPDAREKNLADALSSAEYDWSSTNQRCTALQLIQRDERETGLVFGQNFRDTFPKADVFVDAANQEEMKAGLRRFVELIFGHPCRTPSIPEHAMYLAYASAMRSSVDRQVGAAIELRGDVVATGYNEVPKSQGGHYGEGDAGDRRDYNRPLNSTEQMTNAILRDVFDRLLEDNWIAKDDIVRRLTEDGWVEGSASSDSVVLTEVFRRKFIKESKLPSAKIEDIGNSIHEKARIFQVIEFIRAVHAEVSALMDSARRGVAVTGATLYCTTFPCHECAKSIVAAGISQVVFIEPYPKSKVAQMFDDSISLDADSKTSHVCFRPFVGVAPRAYLDLFSSSNRDRSRRWESQRATATPVLATSGYIHSENALMPVLKARFAREKLNWSDEDPPIFVDCGASAG